MVAVSLKKKKQEQEQPVDPEEESKSTDSKPKIPSKGSILDFDDFLNEEQGKREAKGFQKDLLESGRITMERTALERQLSEPQEREKNLSFRLQMSTPNPKKIDHDQDTSKR